MARLAALGRVHSDGGRRRPVASAGNSIPVSAPNPKSRSIAYCSSGVSRAANLAMAMLLETRIASAMVSEGCGSSSVIVRPSTRHLPPSPDTRSMGDTRRSESNAAAAKIFARDPGSNVSVNARSEEHTSELQSLAYLVCRLLLEKKKTKRHNEDLQNHAAKS